MPHRTIRSLAVALALSAIALASSAQTISKDILYATDSTGQQKADLYQPAGTGPFPAIVYIHGGSWRSGNKKDFAPLAKDLAGRGYAGFSIDYDLRPHSFPLSWQESAAAVRFLREHAAEYNIDPHKIVVTGASAGGELAALLALAPQGPATPVADLPTHDTPVAAAIILSGVYDLTGAYGVIRRYLGGRCAPIQPYCDDASPMHHIHHGAPPFFVGHGDADHTVPYASAQLFTSGMKAAGNPVTFDTAAHGPHMYFTHKQYQALTVDALDTFLRSVFAPPAAARAGY